MRQAQAESQGDPFLRFHDDPRGARRRVPAGLQGARPGPPPVEVAFLAKHGVPMEALAYAAALSRRQGVSADAALLGEGVVAEEVFYRALADHLGAPYLDGDLDVAPGAAATAGNGYVRLRDNPAGLLWLFAPRGGGDRPPDERRAGRDGAAAVRDHEPQALHRGHDPRQPLRRGRRGCAFG
jgi:glycosyltransferase XagB